MNKEVENLCNALDSFGDSIEIAWNDDRLLNEAFNWQHPALNRFDLADMPRTLSKKIRNSNIVINDKDILNIIASIPTKISSFKSTTLPYMFNGNGPNSIPAYFNLLNWISFIIEPEISWSVNNDPNAMPTKISRKLKTLMGKIDDINVDQEKLNNQIKLIDEAVETAESLPADLQDLREARKKIDSISNEALKSIAKVSAAKENSEQLLSDIQSNKEIADKLVENCEDAYRITTSKGLAGSFDQRAKQLAGSMWIWVVGLLGSLIAAWFIGTQRVTILTAALSGPDTEWGLVFAHAFLAFASLGAPLWFAWISTKQIGQRFKLSEDYGYKASVAKAYEGYRKEAARIDKDLEARLFESALSRVEEAPLRLVDNTNHGSPWHELANSRSFKDALSNIPDFRDKVLNLVNTTIPKTERKPALHPVTEERVE